MKHLEGCPSGDFGPCDCGESMTSPGNASDDLPVCCYCDHPLSCAQCGKEQPADDISSLRAQLAAAEARASEYFDRLGESVAKCMSIDEARQAAESQIQTARKALEEIDQLSDNCINAERYGAEDALEDLQAIRRCIKRLRSLDGGGK